MASIKVPTLLIDRQKVRDNINKMAEKARYSGNIFRPHFKTHQSAGVARIFRNAGIRQITVSSVSMATKFAALGWNDITIAFLLNLRETEEIIQLTKGIRLNILLDNQFVARKLRELCHYSIGVFLKIDTGYHRTGLLPEQSGELESVLKVIETSGNLHFKGFLTHAGHSYSAKSTMEVLKIMTDAKDKLFALKQKYKSRFPDIITSYGDTPSCTMAADCKGFDEIRPGNFVYFDVMQYRLGSCSLNEIAVAVACPVVAVYNTNEEIVVYGGAVHVSKEFIEGNNNNKLYGYVVRLNESYHWSKPIAGAYVASLSQEHGLIKIPRKEMEIFSPGDVLGILPIHSCLTANLLKKQIFI